MNKTRKAYRGIKYTKEGPPKSPLKMAAMERLRTNTLISPLFSAPIHLVVINSKAKLNSEIRKRLLRVWIRFRINLDSFVYLTQDLICTDLGKAREVWTQRRYFGLG